MATTYWLNDPCSIFNSLNINPFYSKDKNFNYNSLTRLIILTTLISALVFEKDSYNILIAGAVSVLLSIIIYKLTNNFNGLEIDTDEDIIQMDINEENQVVAENLDEKQFSEQKIKLPVNVIDDVDLKDRPMFLNNLDNISEVLNNETPNLVKNSYYNYTSDNNSKKDNIINVNAKMRSIVFTHNPFPKQYDTAPVTFSRIPPPLSIDYR